MIFNNVSKYLMICIFVLFLGGLFEGQDKGVEIAFRHTMEKINLRGDILPQSLLIYNSADVSQQDSFESSKKGTSLY